MTSLYNKTFPYGKYPYILIYILVNMVKNMNIAQEIKSLENQRDILLKTKLWQNGKQDKCTAIQNKIRDLQKQVKNYLIRARGNSVNTDSQEYADNMEAYHQMGDFEERKLSEEQLQEVGQKDVCEYAGDDSETKEIVRRQAENYEKSLELGGTN